MSEKNLDRIGL